MMDYDKVGKTLDNIKLPEWYRSVSWEVQPMHAQPAPWEPTVCARFRLVYTEPDVINLEPSVQRGRWWYVEDDFTYEAVIRTAWLASAPIVWKITPANTPTSRTTDA